MKTFAKTLVGTVAAGAMAVSAATPAFARDRHDGGIDAGDVVAGALVIGGIAAVAAAASDNDRDRDYRDGRDYGYGRDYSYDRAGYGDYGRYGSRGQRGGGRWDGNSPRRAVEQCVTAAERDANGFGHGRADVTDIRSVRETRFGYEVRGRIAVNTTGRGWRNGDGNYGRGWNNDYRGWNSGLRGYDSGSFTCRIDGGRVIDLDYTGIRGL